MNRRERRQLAILIAVIMVGTAMSAWLFFRTAVTVAPLDVPFTVYGENASKLYLKAIPPGGTGARVVLLDNPGNRTVLMHLTPVGPYAEWLEPDHRWIIVHPAEHRSVVVWVHVPENAEMGDYRAKVDTVGHGITI